MDRHYFIVARDQTSLCEYLARQFASEENVEVFLDRRGRQDRRSGSERHTAPPDGDVQDRRASNRRHQPTVDTQIRSLGYAMLRVE